MGNSQAEKKMAMAVPARWRSSIPLIFLLLFLFVSFLVIVFSLLPSTRYLALSLPPSLYRDHFSLRATSPAASPEEATVLVPTYESHQTSSQANQSGNVNSRIPIAPTTELKSDDIGESSDSTLIRGVPSVSQESVKREIVNGSLVSLDSEQSSNCSSPSNSQMKGAGAGVEEGEMNTDIKDCNMYMGKWVRDESGEYPLYQPGSCPYVDEGFLCQGNGRPDSGYLRWRWKPDGCQLPRFNATDFLERLRSKRLMFVGDSVNRNQFESMLCLLREGLADKSRMYEIHGFKITKGRGFYVFKFVDYNCTVEFIRSHFLVREGVRKNAQGNSNPTLSIDQIDKSAKKWKQIDILVFNTGHWWTHGKTSKGKNYFREGDQVYGQLDAVEAYRRAFKTWGRWIDKNVNPKKQLVFYRGYSSAHFRGGDWYSGGTCRGESEPIGSESGRDIVESYPLKMKIVEEVIQQQMRVPVVLLNVTRLTNFRKDGHPSIYGKNATAGVRVSRRKEDCSHWCLPGIPDAWNELIYATLVYRQTPPVWHA
ncbi:hypothetical protein V2J09_017955 [Rumex salicifolius]